MAQHYHLIQELIFEANRVIVSSAKRYGFGVIPINKAFGGREKLLIGPDHIHPNLLGHRIIAEECIRH